MQRRIERSFLHGQRVAGCVFDPFSHAVPVARAPAQGFEDQQVEATAQQVDLGVGHGLPLCGKERVSPAPLSGKGSEAPSDAPRCYRAAAATAAAMAAGESANRDVDRAMERSSSVMSAGMSPKSGVLRYRSPVSGSMQRTVEPFGASLH